MNVFVRELINKLHSASDYKLKAGDIQRTNANINGDFTILLSGLDMSDYQKDKTLKIFLDALLEKNVIVSYDIIGVFLNIKLSDSFIISVFRSIDVKNLKVSNGDSTQNVVIEYSSPNTNKPLHLGHLRNIFIGYSLSQILKKCGYKVHQVTLVNDRGIHICKSMVAYKLFGENRTPKDVNIKGDHFVGDYYVKFDKQYKEECKNYENSVRKAIDTPILLKAKELLKKWEDGDKETVELWRKMNNWVLDGFNETYNVLGIKFDKEYFESNTYLLGKDMINYGLEKGVFYKKPDNSVWVDLEDVGMDKKLLLRGDGTSVYITQDIGTVNLRYNDYKFNKMLYVVGDEQIYHFKVLKAILKKLNLEYCNDIYHISYGMVELPNGKMKSREGTVVDADDIIQEMYKKAVEKTEQLNKLSNLDVSEKEFIYRCIGMNSLKFFLLKVDPKKKIVFDPDKSIDFNGDTATFVMYSYVRMSSLLDKNGFKSDEFGEFELSEIEKQLIFTLAEFNDILLKAAKEYNPSFLVQYLLKISKEFNKFYAQINVSKINDVNRYNFCIMLIRKIKEVIEQVFDLLGIKTINHM